VRNDGDFQIYLVGGAVRDGLLGRPVRERDWVVVGASHERLTALGYRPVDEGVPVYRHPESGEEVARARRETKRGVGHRGFTFDTGPDVSIEEDLRRRDLTVNAMAQSPDGQLIDPFRGEIDLGERRLRHVSEAFVEDPLRVLRAARFAAELGPWGFEIDAQTTTLMQLMAAGGELSTLSPDRIWKETLRAAASERPLRYFVELDRCGALDALTNGNWSRAHANAAKALPWLESATTSGLEGEDRVAALLAGVGLESQDHAQALGEALGAANSLLELARTLAAEVRLPLPRGPERAAGLMARIEGLDGLRRRERLARLVRLLRASPDATARDTGATIERAASAAASIKADEVRTPGLSGPALGAALRQRRVEAIARAIPDSNRGSS
jgi:tRNA nucleotidyltransferase (CCA-adding enzyme)